jgi:N-acyl-D-amino-acid deacylase
MTLAQVAAERGVDSVTALIDLIRDSERMEKANKSKLQSDHLPHEALTADSADVNVETIIATSMVEEDVAALMKWPHTNFCTDGSLTGSHPRSFGSYPRILGHYVREQGVLSLEAAIHKATALAAQHMGITGRGTIAVGQSADLVLFDPATIIDRATPKAPHEVSTGVSRVWVNGVEVLVDGRPTAARAGKTLRRLGGAAG